MPGPVGCSTAGAMFKAPLPIFLCLSTVGAVVCLGLLGVFQLWPRMTASLCHPAALRLAPSSVSRM